MLSTIRNRFAASSAIVIACAFFICAEVLTLTPQSVVELAQKQSVMVKSAEYSRQSAEYSKKGAFSAFLPVIKGNVTYTRLDEPPSIPGIGGDMAVDTTDPILMGLMQLFSGLEFESPPQDIWNIGVTVTQPLFMGGRILNGYRASKYNLESEKFTWERKQDEVRVAALQLFWGYVSQVEELKVAEENKAWFENLIKTQEIMYESGMIIEHVLLKTKIGYSQARLAVLQKKHAMDKLRESLLVFLNMPLSTEIVIESAKTSATADIPQSLSEDEALKLVSNRQDIRAMELQLESLKTLRKIQAAGYIPSLLASYNFKFANDNYENQDNLDPGWSLSVILDWPIFDWGKNYHEVKKIDCQIAQVALGMEAALLQACAEVTEAHRKLSETLQLVEITREGAESAQRALEIAELQYQEGALTHVELHESRKELTVAQAQQIQARTARELALIAYELAIGH